MDNNNVNSSVLSEHRKVVSTRYILAVINFLAIFAGTIVTLFFMSRRGVHGAILTHIWIMFILNLLQIGLCITEYTLRNVHGIVIKRMPLITYTVGIAWVASLVSMVAVGSIKLGTFRTDLAVIAGIQLIVAFVAYIFWPMMDRRAIDAMISRRIRDDEKKRVKKSRAFVRAYGFVCCLMVLAQAAALIVYKMPPTFYDLFADTRALEYELNDEKDGYIVTTVYKGTSPKVNVPASYNNLPVVGIAKGALVDENIVEKYQVTEIVFGTETVKEDGTVELVSNLKYIADGAIVNNKIEKLQLPESINSIGNDAVNSDSLRTLEYSSAAEFKYESFAGCPGLSKVIMSGEHVGKIISLNGMDSSKVTIEVDKDIYNEYREANFEYVKSFRPILDDDEFCIDFFTDCEYYIDSIFAKRGEKVTLTVDDLQKLNTAGVPLSVDTKAYLSNPHELGTNGAKAESAFRGWYTDQNFVAECKFNDGVTFDTNTSLYAKWIPEYKAELDWGTFTPADQTKVMYWTEEDQRTFPAVNDRVGYAAGLIWNIVGGDGKQIVTTEGITENVTMRATWLFDAPGISINHELNGKADGEGTTLNYAQFVYDENKTLALTATHTHPLDGHYYDEKTVQYTYEWVNSAGEVVQKAQLHKLQNVADSGEYTLRVTAHSPYGETSVSEVGYEARISKKPLDLGDAKLNNANVIYNAMNHTLFVEGNVVTERVKTTFNYYVANSESGELVSTAVGVMNAGSYRVEVVFEKDNASEAANYETKVLTANLRVDPKPLTFGGWSNDTFVYNGFERVVTLNVGGVLGTDTVEIFYQGNVQKDSGSSYTAVATGIDNPNYTLDAIEAAEENTHNWSITPKPVNVKNWQTDGNDYASSVITYDGKEHTLYAVMEGVMAGDDVQFVYDTATFGANAQTVAGKYKTVILGTTNPNYYFDTGAANASMEWEIKPRTLTISYRNVNAITYRGTAQGIMADITGFADGESEQFTVDMLNLAGNTAAARITTNKNGACTVLFTATDTGTYSASILGLISTDGLLANYSMGSEVRSFTITPKEINVSDSAESLVYNGQSQEYYLFLEGVFAKDVELFQNDNVTTTASEVRAIDGKVALVYKASEVGSYPTSVTVLNAPSANYTLGTAFTGSFSVSPRPVTVCGWSVINKATGNTVSAIENGGSVVYNFNGYQISAKLDGVVAGENVVLTLSDFEKNAAGAYTTVASLSADYGNYTLSGVNKLDWSITPYVLDVTWKIQGGTNKTFTYDGASKEAVPYTSPLGTDTVALTFSKDARVGTNAGSYTTVVSGTGNPNYIIGEGESFTWTITPKRVSVSWTDETSFVYNGAHQGPTFSISGLVSSDITGGNLTVVLDAESNTAITGVTQTQISYALSAENSYSIAAKGISVDAGSYDVYNVVIKRGGVQDGNYSVSGGSAGYVIAPKTVTLNGVWSYSNPSRTTSQYVAGGSNLVYNSENFTLTTALTSGSLVSRLGTQDVINLVYSNNVAVHAGSYTAAVTGISGTYAANYTLASGNDTCEWDIAKKPVKVVWNASGFVYNGSSFSKTAYVATGAANDTDGKLYSTDSYTLTYSGNNAKSAGSYTARVTAISNKDYELDSSSSLTCEWSIAPMPVRLAWSYTSTVYNGNVQYPIATVTNNVSGEVVEVDMYSGYQSNVNAATGYTVTATGLSNSNYTLEGGTSLTSTYDIVKRTLSYSWYAVYEGSTSTKQKLDGLVYNGKNLTVLVELSGVCNNDTVNAVYVNNNYKNAGNGYTASVSLDGASSANYVLPDSAKSVTFNIAKKPVKVNWKWDGASTQSTIVYDGQVHTLVPTLSDLVSSDSCNFTATMTKVSGGNNYSNAGAIDAGQFKVTVSALTNSNYTLDGVADTSATITIAPQPVSISWTGSDSVIYDGQNHYRYATVIGANDRKNVSFDYTSGNYKKATGSYTFTVGSLNDSNYTLTGSTGSASASLKIAPKVVTVQWTGAGSFTYKYGTTHTVSASITNVESGDSVSLNYNTSSRSVTNAGTYEFVITGTNNSNYTVDGASGLTATVVISPAEVSTLSWSGTTSVPYDGQSHSLTATAQTSDGTVVELNYTNNGKVNAGSYDVSVELKDKTNYYFKTGLTLTKKLTITQKLIGISWQTAGEYTYTGNKISFLPTLSGVVGSDNVVANCSGSYGDLVNAGTYGASVVSLGGSAAANYRMNSDPGATLIIKPQSVKITWSGATEVTYDGQLHGLTPNVVGATDGKTVTYTLEGNSAANAGIYHFRVVGLANSNYTLDGAQGNTTATLTIKQRTVTISWIDLEQSLSAGVHAPRATVENLVTGDKVSAMLTYEVKIQDIDSTGSYTITVTGLAGTSASNYTIEGAAGLTVTLVVTE